MYQRWGVRRAFRNDDTLRTDSDLSRLINGYRYILALCAAVQRLPERGFGFRNKRAALGNR